MWLVFLLFSEILTLHSRVDGGSAAYMYHDLKRELEYMKHELKARLACENQSVYRYEWGEEFAIVNSEEARKKKIVIHNVQADLADIERALFKLDIGMYGICEETGERLTLEQLRILPTARCMQDFSYEVLRT